ncbi:MAG TPA: hypothetical protein VMJ10_31340 [Kofleriaceae bacterium]|nr:hypothetical protein [Kofleriaceae bacterium]
MRRLRAIGVALAIAAALVAPAAAQAPSCTACARGDATIARFALHALPPLAAELGALRLDDPLSADQYARLLELRRRVPALVELGAVPDRDRDAIAAALCRADTGDCFEATAHALRCLADRCTVALPPTDPHHADLVTLPDDCHQYSTHARSQRYGLGVDWGTGWQRSRYPSDGGAWSLGIAGRLRLDDRFGVVARVDRVAGRDQATDANHDGYDDFSTGTITRITALAGPTIVLDHSRFADTVRFARLDLLAGYLTTPSQADEAGPAAGADLTYQMSIVQVGLRFVQGFGDARTATMLLGHVGLAPGSIPGYDDQTDCGAATSPRRTPLAIGMDFPLVGYGLSSQLGYLVPGLGFEAAWHVTHRLDALARADLLVYPGYDRDRVLHQALLAGARIAHGHRHHGNTGWFTTIAAGYSHGIGLDPTSVGSGPIADVSLGWGGEWADGAGYLRLHARSGIGPDNYDYRAVFLSAGFELRIDPNSWRDRD